MTPLPLQRYYPELLWPTKERKARHKFRNKDKVLLEAAIYFFYAEQLADPQC